MANVHNLKLNNGKSIPMLSLEMYKSGKNQVYEAVKYAILEAGYRLIVCALAYRMEL